MFWDPHIIPYAVGAFLVVLVAYVVMSFFTETVRAIHKRGVEEEKVRKEEERKKNNKAA